IGPAEAVTEVLERRSEGKPAGAFLEQCDRSFEILEPLLDQAADLRLDRRDRLDVGIQLHPPSNRGEGPRRQVTIAGGQRDPGQMNVVGDVDREPWQERPTVVQTRRRYPAESRSPVPQRRSEE